jgi:hypothetical protein
MNLTHFEEEVFSNWSKRLRPKQEHERLNCASETVAARILSPSFIVSYR